MQFSENWLRRFVDPKLTSDELSHLLTMAGLEVEEIDPVAPPFSNIVVAEVREVQRHPDADRLNVCQVDAGTLRAHEPSTHQGHRTGAHLSRGQ